MRKPIAVTAVEVFSPIGLNVLQTATSIRSGISRVALSNLIDDIFDQVGIGYLAEDVIGPLDKELGSKTFMSSLCARLLRLASACLQEIASSTIDLQDVAILLAAPGGKDHQLDPVRSDFFQDLMIQSNVQFLHEKSRVFFGGKAGVFLALSQALKMLSSGGYKHVLMGGVDSFLDPLLLSTYQAERRILREGVSDGFIPGEGAAFLLLSTQRACQEMKRSPLAFLGGLGQGREKGHRYSDKPYLGEGLASAFSELFSRAGKSRSRVKTVFAGLNGENFNAKEWGTACLRNREQFEEEIEIEHPAEYLGDAGAALAPIMMATAAFGLHKGYWEGPILVWASSDEAERGAVMLSKS